MKTACAWRGRPAASAARRARAFTLIEMLVVLVIAGILASVATLAITRNPHTDLLEDARRLALLFESAGDEAQVRATPLGWEPVRNGYRFMQKTRDGEWRPVADDLLGPRKWTAHITGVTIRYAGSDEPADHVVFGVEAIDPAVVVTLSSETGQVSVFGTGNGRYGVR